MTSPHPSCERVKVVRDVLTIGILLGAFAAPHLDEFMRPAKARGPEEYELRSAAVRPGWPGSLREIHEFPEQFSAWFDDHMGLRDRLLRWNSEIKLLGFGVSPTDSALPGANGFLFCTVNHTIEIHRGVRPFGPDLLGKWVRALEARRAWCERRGIRYLYFVAPDKESIYSDYMPSWCAPLGPTRLDQLLIAIQREAPLVELVDMRAVFRAARARDTPRDKLYSALGTHWDGTGCYTAYRVMAEALQRHFPAIHPLGWDELDKSPLDFNSDSWALRMYINDLLDPHLLGVVVSPDSRRPKVQYEADPAHRILRFTADDSGLPKAMMFHDSFAGGVVRLLSEHFASFVCKHGGNLDEGLIEEVQPDVVFDLFVERNLGFANPLDLIPKDAPPSGQEFERSHDVLFRLDPSALPAGLVARGNLVMAARADPPALDLEIHGSTDTLILPRFNAPDGTGAVVRVEIESPLPSSFEIFYRLPGDREYLRKRSRVLALKPGRNILHCALEAGWIEQPIMIRAGRDPGTYRLLGLEARAVHDVYEEPAFPELEKR